MNARKIIGLIMIASFALMTLVMAIDAQIQVSTPFKIQQQIIDENTIPLSEQINFVSSNNANNPSVFNAKPVKPAPEPKSYALTIEIDWIEGHQPTDAVLDYMIAYYQTKNIELTINLGDNIPYNSIYDDGISDSEFWTIERQYNGGIDTATNANDGIYTVPEKWVLYGTTVQGSENVVGYTFCVGTIRDLKAGNYIYIADKAADEWAVLPTINVSPVGAEAVVLMHEFGHSIGICIVRAGSEIYCSDYYCVMSYLRSQNAGNTNNWYYCSSHWKTINLDYYVV